jgi:hypothetical protein
MSLDIAQHTWSKGNVFKIANISPKGAAITDTIRQCVKNRQGQPLLSEPTHLIYTKAII